MVASQNARDAGSVAADLIQQPADKLSNRQDAGKQWQDITTSILENVRKRLRSLVNFSDHVWSLEEIALLG